MKGMARAALLSAQKDREMIKVPELILGFKIKHKKQAVAQLDRLVMLATAMVKDVPPLKGRPQALQGRRRLLPVAGTGRQHDPLVRGSAREIEENKGQFDDLVKHIKQTKLSISIGVKGNYILLGITSTVKDFEKLNGQGKLLIDRAELKPVRDNAEKSIVSVSWSSKALASSLAGQFDLSGYPTRLKGLLALASELKEERKKAIEKDLDALGEDMKGLTPDVGASLSFSYLTDTGYDSYDYAYEQGKKLKGLKCTLQNHFGGKPIFAAASAFKCDGSSYKTMVKWIKTFYNHGEAVFMDMADDDQKDAFKKGAKEILPLFGRLDEATTKYLIPALGNSGLGVVVDAKWSSKKWHTEIPDFGKPMPMLEMGFLLGINDSKKFATAIKEYRTTLNELLEKGRAAAPNNENIPEFKIPAPESEKGKNGTFLYYPVPEEAGLDKQFQPVLGIGKTVSVLCLSKKHADRLMGNTPLKVKSGPLARKGNLVSVYVLDWNAFIDATSPWLEQIVPMTMIAVSSPDSKPDPDAEKKIKEATKVIVDQMRVGFKVLKVFKGATGGSYVEGGAGHSQRGGDQGPCRRRRRKRRRRRNRSKDTL